MAYIHPDKWEQEVTEPNITAASTVKPYYETILFYALKDSGVFAYRNGESTFLSDSSHELNIQPIELKGTTHMASVKSDWGPIVLYASSKDKLFLNTHMGNGGGRWSEITHTEPIHIKEMNCNFYSLLILTEEHKLYSVQGDTLIPCRTPPSLLAQYDSLTPLSIGGEQMLDNPSKQWILYEGKRGDIIEKVIATTLSQDSVIIKINDSYNEKCAIAYGKNFELDHVLAVSNENTISLEVFEDPRGERTRRELQFPEGTIITDLGLFDRDFPTTKPNRLECYSSVVLIATTNRGSYALGVRELMTSTEPLEITDNIDSSLCVYDTIPSSKVLYTKSHTMQYMQYVLNKKGIGYYIAPIPSALIDTENSSPSASFTFTTTAKRFSLSLKEIQSGSLSLLNIRGQEISTVTFANCKTVSLPKATNLAKGVYLLKLETQSGVITEKIRVE